MILIHNSLLFSLEYLYFNLQILGKIISSSIVTLVLVLILETFKVLKNEKFKKRHKIVSGIIY